MPPHNEVMARYRLAITGLVLGAGVLALGGCNTALFPEDQPRTQYDRYMTLRGESRPAKRVSATGPDEPDLRARLKPLN